MASHRERYWDHSPLTAVELYWANAPTCSRDLSQRRITHSRAGLPVLDNDRGKIAQSLLWPPRGQSAIRSRIHAPHGPRLLARRRGMARRF